MKNFFILLSVAVVMIAFSADVQAGDIFSRIDSVLSTAERTMDTTDNTINRADRLSDRASDKVPASRRRSANETNNVQNDVSASDEAILRKAQEIEDRRILEQADAIKRKRGY